ncbi:MAG: phage protease [Verrucomicrobiota bacterium]
MNKESHRIAQNNENRQVLVMGRGAPEGRFATSLNRFARGLGKIPCESSEPILADFANEAPELPDLPIIEPIVQDLSGGMQIECIANSTSGPMGEDGFMRLVKFGDHPQGPNDIQRFQTKQSNAIVTRFKAAANAAVRMIFKTKPYPPAYYGHPDHPQFAAQGHNDFMIRADIMNMETREDGLYIKPDFTDQGNELLSGDKKLYWSPRWVSLMTGDENGKRIWEPFKLLSAGLTPTPNILGSAANALPQSQSQPPHTMEWIKSLLMLLGFSEDQANALANNTDGAPTAEQIEARVTGLRDQANGYWDLEKAIMKVLGYTDEQIDAFREDGASAPTLEDLISRLTEAFSQTVNAQANEQLTTAQADLATATERVTQLTSDIANERRERATLIVEQAISENRCEESRREETITSLAGAADFANASEEILTADEVLPTGGQTNDLGKRKGEIQDQANASQLFDEGLADFANEKGYDFKQGEYQKAHSEFRKTEKGKKLYEAMSDTTEGE